MVLVPWRFYEDLSCFTREMNQLFDRFFGKDFLDDAWRKISYPPLQVGESKNEILVCLHISGFSPEEIEVIFKDDLLIINGEKQKNNSITHPQKERVSFSRTIHIPKKIHTDKIEAKFKDDELIIILPKIQEGITPLKVRIE